MLRSLWLQGTGVFCSKSNNIYGNSMKVTQIPSGANAPGALGQTGANTANFVRSSPQSEGSQGAQCHLLMLGPFGKVPDRVTGAIFHALVQCVAPWGSQLYQNWKLTCQPIIAEAFICLWLFSMRVDGLLLEGLFSQTQIQGLALSTWQAHLDEAALKMPLWAVLDPTACPSGRSQGCSTHPLALTYSFPSFYLRLSFSHRLCHVDPSSILPGLWALPLSSLPFLSCPPLLHLHLLLPFLFLSPKLLLPLLASHSSDHRLPQPTHPQFPCPLKGSGWFRQQVHAMD